MMSPEMTRSSKPVFSFYFVLFFLIGPVYGVVPFSWAFVVHGIWYNAIWRYTVLQKIIFVWAFIEVIFSLYYRNLACRVTKTPPAPPTDLRVLQTAFNRVLKAGMAGVWEIKHELEVIAGLSQDEEEDEKERGGAPRLFSPVESIEQLAFEDPRAKDFRQYMRTWFYKKPWGDIHKYELRQWLYWSTFNSHLPPDAKLSPFHRQLLEDGIVLFEKRSGAKIPEGSNPKCPPLLLTLDPIVVHSRPLAFYVIVWVLNYYVRLSFKDTYDLKYCHCDDFEYIVRIPKGWKSSSKIRPIVFLHGLGLGLLQYYHFIKNIIKELPSHPIMIPLQPHISQNFFHSRYLKPISPHDSVAKLSQILKKMGWEGYGVDILSHSNGSFFHAWILKARPELIRRSCFVDPVTFCSWEGDVCYNFVYQSCVTGVEILMRYFVGTELGIANVIQRHFDWSANSLWFEEIPNALASDKTAFFLAGKDAILDARRVQKYLQSHGVRKGLWFDVNARHGEALIAGGEGMCRVVAWLRGECDEQNNLSL